MEIVVETGKCLRINSGDVCVCVPVCVSEYSWKETGKCIVKKEKKLMLFISESPCEKKGKHPDQSFFTPWLSQISFSPCFNWLTTQLTTKATQKSRETKKPGENKCHILKTTVPPAWNILLLFIS